MKVLFFFCLFFSFLQAQESKTLYFDFAKEMPNAISLNHFEQWISMQSNIEILTIAGYCDSVDTNLSNKKLASKRILNVLNLLKSKDCRIANNLIQNVLGEDFEQSKIQAENRKVTFTYRILDESITETEPIVDENPKEESLVEKIEKERISLIDKFEMAKIGDKIVIHNIHFQFNSEVIIPESEPLVEQLLLIMELNPNLEIKIYGHICCNPDPKDTKLSFRRAFKIYNYLINNGIQLRRLAYKGFGSNQPIYPIPENNEEERIANRRVEIEIVKK
ncbi:OmpA family protein [Flavobacterium sp.]|uniref:OmpA family protein n=1 Tax=Flavobacterium sp. TaxID=239 RepID=UPI002FDA4A27